MTISFRLKNRFELIVADAVYETMLDWMELKEVKNDLGKEVYHMLIIDNHYTWWTCGRSYLCRIIDVFHIGLLSEVISGRDVVDRIPELAKEWRMENNNPPRI